MKRKWKALLLLTVLICAFLCTGCGKTSEAVTESSEEVTDSSPTAEDPAGEVFVQPSEESRVEPEIPEGNYIELALNVYYNDGEHKYYSNESGPSIYVTGEGTYSVSFDCEKDLSEAAVSAGVKSLTNLTAIYLLDMGVGKGEQSPLTDCMIRYDQVEVDGTPLTITKTESRSAFKSSGVFDTNDPINAWDGSAVEEVTATAEHVANFIGLQDPKRVTVTFTLSDLKWKSQTESETSKEITLEQTNQAVFSTLDLAKTDAVTLAKYMGNGINLGNTMEAYGHTTLGTGAGVSSYETYWGQPVTTAQMFQGMKACGFDSVRIPIAWTNMMDYESGDYTINKAYLDRVEEIVNYALDAEMFVIINDHWDGGWWGMFGSKTEATVQKAWTIYESIWSQVAERFSDYSEMLIFESANEELGSRLNENTVCADSGRLTESQCYQLTNEINQKFVEIVRSSGGKNADRFLLIAGYNTDIEKTVDSRFVMPKDSAENKLLVSVHYYTPWNYCGAEKQARWGLKSDYQLMDNLLKRLTRFTKAGVGVIIGEYAALPIYHSDNGSYELKNNTLEFTKHFLDNCDVYGYCPMLWSCNDFFNRNTLGMISSEIGQLFAERSYEKETADPNYLTKVQEDMKQAESEALDKWPDVKAVTPGAPVAWIMWNGGAGTYSVGDTYNPADCTEGITSTEVIITGAGEYEVGLDFADGNDGLTFGALAIANGERLFKNAVIEIKEVYADGKKIDLIGEPYTTSDDGSCTRVNLINSWVNQVPQDARTASGDLTDVSAVILDETQLVGIHSIRIKFELVIP